MSRTIVWTDDSPCGSGPTCPRIGRDEENGCTIVQGPQVTDLAVLNSHAVAPGQTLIAVPSELVPGAGTNERPWATLNRTGTLAYVLGELIIDPSTRALHEVPDQEVLVAIAAPVAEVV